MRLLASCHPFARRTSLALAGVLALSLAAAGPSAAAPTSDPLPQGSDWSVTRVPGGFEITKQLGEPLPVVSDIPVLEVDGVPVGAAIESLDGTSVSVVTTADLADVSSVELGWGSGGEKAVPTDAPVTSALDPVVAQSKARLRTLSAAADDGSAPGTFSYVEDDYHFGHTAVPLAAIGGVRGEMTGRVYLPTTGGERPTIVLLHGRHTSCSVPAGQPSVSNPGRWPCVGAQVPIPSYKGYESLAQTLATHGYAVLSISANSVNANDNQLALDYGAQARGQLVLDTLKMLRKANAGEPVSFDDAATGTTVDLATALSVDTEAYDHGTAPTSGTNPGEAITPADLVGRFDLSNVGLMGHSRGGEGVVSSVNLNQALAEPFGITSVLPLAPVDFTRPSVADTDMLVLLPYCDGDVSNQQGQHFSDDSRYAFPDDSLRSTLWVMGTNHNFFNTVWTPGLYPLAVSDDWRAADSVCGPTAETTLRLSPEDQYQLGVATMSAWFRFTMGGEDAFGPMFDGSADPVLSSVPSAWLWSTATAPASARKDVETFTEPSSRVRPYGSVTLSTCASAGGRTLAQALPACATASSIRSTSAMPHWTPASFAPNAPASPMLRMTWTATSGSTAASARITVPAGSRDAAGFDALTFKTAPDESVLRGTDLTVTVLDGSGATWSAPVSTINPRAIERLPASGSTTLNKIVLQQVSIPVSTLADAIDVTDLREIRLAGAVGLDETPTGGVYLSDLALQSTSTGTQTGLAATPTINVAPTVIEEGDAPGEAQVAVYLDKPATREATAWFTLIGSTTATGKAGLAAAKVTFAPGESCQAVTVPTYGDRTADATASVAYKMGVSVPSGVIVGAEQFGNLTIREDDHAAGSSVALRAVGTQGDPCRELAELGTVGTVGASPAQPAPGTTTTLTAPGYRAGEHVVISDGDTAIGETLASPDGVATLAWQVPATASLGTHTLSATGGTGRTSQGSAAVLTPTTSTLTMNPVVPAIGKATTLTVDVTGRPTGAVVTFRDGSTTLGTAPVVGGRAMLQLPRGLAAGKHSLTATTPATSTSTASSTSVIGFELVKGETTIVVITSAPNVRYGTAISGALAVGGAKGGTVTLKVGSTTQAVRLDARGAGSFRLPATLAPGKHTVTLTHAATATTGASSARTTVTVVKARPTVTVKASKLRKGKKATVTVTVPGVSGAARPSGKVVVTLAGKKVATAKVKASGKTTVRVPVRKVGKQKIKVTYQGDTRYQGATKTITVRAR